MFNKALSVEELNHYIHSIFDAEEMLHGITVFGEVSGFKISGPHAYFTLKGANAAVSCNLFQYRKTYVPKDGDSILVKGSPDYSEKTGKLSFNVLPVQPVGVGRLHVELEKLKAKLLAEGIFDEAHKVAIPRFPKDVCVITSKTGAVIRDIYRTTRNVNQGINLHVYNVRVQGEGAENEIADALRKSDGVFDVIIVARGGGSFEDLAPFNTEKVARAIYDCVTPVISAVGHETDFSLSDLAADARAATPTAAAHMIAYNEEEYIATVFSLMSRIALASEKILHAEEDRFSGVVKSFIAGGGRLLDKNESRLRLSMHAIESAGKMFCTKKETLLEKLLLRYAGCNQLNILQKGYMTLSKEGKKVVSIGELSVGDEVTIRAKDGMAKALIKELNNEI